jgi:hypothetical protein
MNEEQLFFIENLKKSLGIISVAMGKTGIDQETYNKWLKNKEFQKALEDTQNLSIDYVENKLLNLINEGDLGAIQFYLKTKGKKRGY